MPRLLPLFLIFSLSSCSRPEVATSFYYWKVNYEVSDGEKELMSRMGCDALYVRYFDVVMKDGKAVPEATSRIDSGALGDVKVIPVVYVTNQVMKSLTGEQIGPLANNIVSLVLEIDRHIGREPEEWQIDCDWSDNTREQYFGLLKLIRKEISPARLSATIRLHQVKYKDRTGVPPVDRGMLMHYNMGKLGSPDAPNSIYNHADAENYIRHVDDYPLPLDLALPVFSWAVHFRDGQIQALNSKHGRSDYDGNRYFKNVRPDLYMADSSVVFRGDYFQRGDLVKIEDVSPELLLEAAEKIARHLPRDDRKIVFFDLDSTILTRHTYENLNKVVDRFR